MVDLPSPKNISNTFFDLTRPDINLIYEENATYEGVVDEVRNVALVQWSQFIEHDLVKTVFQTMSMHFALGFIGFIVCVSAKNQLMQKKKHIWWNFPFLLLVVVVLLTRNDDLINAQATAIRSNVVKMMQQMRRPDIVIQHALHLISMLKKKITADYHHAWTMCAAH